MVVSHRQPTRSFYPEVAITDVMLAGPPYMYVHNMLAFD